jgi:hypothetical protein
MEINRTPNYEFNMYIIKPNICDENRTDSFDENFYKYFNLDNKTVFNRDKIKTKMTSYLLKKDYLMTKTMSFNSMLVDIEKYINPANQGNRSFEVKTCLDNENELIMFIYDASINDKYQFNHMATIFGPNFETVFGPVFITKILKNKDGLPIKHVDITLEDLTKLWINIKQIKYWNFINNEWVIDEIFNNNKSISSKEYKYINIDKSIIFYKYKLGAEQIDNVKQYLKLNIHNVDKLTMFENIKICRLKTGEYVNENLNYNVDIGQVQEHIISTAMNGFEDFDKVQVEMESIFQDISEKIIL